jgi:biopolymer transport protein TolQ
MTSGNPFISAYIQSDWFGKSIFWLLFLLSAVSWTLIVHKTWIFFQVRKLSKEVASLFSEKEPLGLQFAKPAKGHLLEVPNPFFEIYKALKQKTLQVIGRNHFFAPGVDVALSEADLALVESQVQTALASQVKELDKNLFVLSTIVTLAPFLGLLGTVWGILLAFTELHTGGKAMLAGLSMALATTVIGLVVAIPALIGYNYLKNGLREYRRDMEDFSHLLLNAIELQYRRPDHAQKISTIP